MVIHSMCLRTEDLHLLFSEITEDIFILNINEFTFSSSQNSHNHNTLNVMEGNINFLMACPSYKFYFINRMFSFSMNRLNQLETNFDF